MKLKIIIICLLILIHLDSFAQPIKGQGNQDVISLIQQNKELQKTNDVLQKKLDESITEIKREEKFFSNLNLYFVILGILITSFTIFIPVLTFFLGIRPARLEIKNLRQKVHEYMISKNRDTVDFAIEKLTSNIEKDRYEAALILSNQVDFKYNDSDLQKIVNAYPNIKDTQTKFFIKNILTTRESIISEKFFRELLKKEKFDQNVFQILRYIFSSNSDFTADIASVIIENDKPLIQFSMIISFSLSISHSLTEEFLNNSKLIDQILMRSQISEIKSIGNSIKQSITNNIGAGLFDETYFNKRITEMSNEEITKKNIEKNEKQFEETKLEEQVKPIKDVVIENGFHIFDGKVVDKLGKEYSKKQLVQTMLGLAEVKEAIKFEDRIIYIDDIPEKQ